MEVLFTYTSYPLSAGDWRGRFMFDLARALAARLDVRLRLWGPPGPAPANTAYTATAREAGWLKELLHAGGIAHLCRTRPFHGLIAATRLLGFQRRAYRRNTDVDVVHVNWLQNAISLRGTNTPALVTALGSDLRMLSWPGILPLLRAVFRERPCVIAPNSEWMMPILQKHFGDVARIDYVPFGIDPRWFAMTRGMDPHAPRRWLVVLRVTAKKIGPLFDWGENLFTGDDELHLFGPMQENITIPAWVRYHGATNPETLAKEWYPRAAGMLSLSNHDEGRPQVLLEAMASGLPVLVSPIAAHRDIVADGETGRLVDSRESLRTALASLRDHSANTALGERACAWVREHIGTWADCAARYAGLYRELRDGRQ
jgi:hypothetical protein